MEDRSQSASQAAGLSAESAISISSDSDAGSVRSSASGSAAAGAGRPKRRRVRAFRVCAKQFALTYPQCPVARAEFHEVFQRQFQPGELAVAREQHADGHYHLHLYVGYQKRVDVRSSRHFDVSVDGTTYHPNVQKVRNRAQWLGYISKGDDHGVLDLPAEAPFDPLLEDIGKRKSKWLDYQWSEQFRVQQSLRPVDYPVRLECVDKVYELSAPDPRVKKRSWWIVAPPNAGKTRWLNKTFAGQRIYSPRSGPYPFEGYLNQDIIVYDDRDKVSFSEFASVLNTWDIVQPVAGEVRFTTLNWKLGHTRSIIVLSNHTIEDIMPVEDHARMKKRFIQIVNPKLIPPEEMSDNEDDAASLHSRPSAYELNQQFA